VIVLRYQDITPIPPDYNGPADAPGLHHMAMKNAGTEHGQPVPGERNPYNIT